MNLSTKLCDVPVGEYIAATQTAGILTTLIYGAVAALVVIGFKRIVRWKMRRVFAEELPAAPEPAPPPAYVPLSPPPSSFCGEPWRSIGNFGPCHKPPGHEPPHLHRARDPEPAPRVPGALCEDPNPVTDDPWRSCQRLRGHVGHHQTFRPRTDEVTEGWPQRAEPAPSRANRLRQSQNAEPGRSDPDGWETNPAFPGVRAKPVDR